MQNAEELIKYNKGFLTYCHNRFGYLMNPETEGRKCGRADSKLTGLTASALDWSPMDRMSTHCWRFESLNQLEGLPWQDDPDLREFSSTNADDNKLAKFAEEYQ